MVIDKKDTPTRPSLSLDHRGAVLPPAAPKVPMPTVKPTEGAKPNNPAPKSQDKRG
jgi:hypothetical protein